MEFEFICKVLMVIFGCGVAFYAIAKVLDFVFGELSANRAERRIERQDVRRAGMAKACIRTYTDGQRRMCKELTRSIVDNMYDMAKKMGEL